MRSTNRLSLLAAPCLLLVAATTAAGQYLPLVPPKPWVGSGFPAVAMSGNKAVVASQLGGANHTCYVFDVTTGEVVVELVPGDDVQPGLVHSIAVDGATAILGVPYADGVSWPVGSGAAYLFDIQTGAQIAKLAPSDEHNRYMFGVRVGISGDRAIVSNEAQHLFPAVGGGWHVYLDHAAYLFDADTGAQVARISPDLEGASGDAQIGVVAIGASTIVLGMQTVSYSPTSTTNQGIRLFHTDDGSPKGSLDGPFLWKGSIAIEGNVAVVPSPFHAIAVDLASGKQVHFEKKFSGHIAGYGSGIAVDDGVVVSNGWELVGGAGVAQAWVHDLATGALKQVIEAPCGYKFGNSVGVAIDDGIAVLSTWTNHGPWKSGVYAVDASGTWTSLCQGLPGTNGLPMLNGSGDLGPGSFVTLRIDDARPIAPVILAMGKEEWSQPLLGGVMVPKPTWLHYVGYTNAAGEMEMHIPNLPVISQGTDLYLQAWIQDPAGPKGYAATNAVRATRQ